MIFQGTKPVTCHAYNADQTQLALSQNDEKVLIYKRVGKKWEKTAELIEVSLKAVKTCNFNRKMLNLLLQDPSYKVWRLPSH